MEDVPEVVVFNKVNCVQCNRYLQHDDCTNHSWGRKWDAGVLLGQEPLSHLCTGLINGLN